MQQFFFRPPALSFPSSPCRLPDRREGQNEGMGSQKAELEPKNQIQGVFISFCGTGSQFRRVIFGQILGWIRATFKRVANLICIFFPSPPSLSLPTTEFLIALTDVDENRVEKDA